MTERAKPGGKGEKGGNEDDGEDKARLRKRAGRERERERKDTILISSAADSIGPGEKLGGRFSRNTGNKK